MTNRKKYFFYNLAKTNLIFLYNKNVVYVHENDFSIENIRLPNTLLTNYRITST